MGQGFTFPASAALALSEIRVTGQMQGMSRIALALPLGLLGFFAYLGMAMVLADQVLDQHWLVQGAYYLVAGTFWALPAHWLMLWAGHKA